MRPEEAELNLRSISPGGASGILLLAGIIALVSLAAIWAAPRLYERFELAASGYEVKGVDVSHYQGDIDWLALRASGVRFAYIKATEGVSFRDSLFADNWKRSGEAGIPRGAYHFFLICRTGAEQAANFIAVVPAGERSLPHALDAEQMEPCANGRAVADPIAEILVFLDETEKRFGKRPVIYTTHEFYDKYLLSNGKLSERLNRERFWLRSLHRAPKFGGTQWTLWQYHNRGRRPGVDGPVDLNAFNGQAEEFERFASP
jgi:lysozyme